MLPLNDMVVCTSVCKTTKLLIEGDKLFWKALLQERFPYLGGEFGKDTYRLNSQIFSLNSLSLQLLRNTHNTNRKLFTTNIIAKLSEGFTMKIANETLFIHTNSGNIEIWEKQKKWTCAYSLKLKSILAQPSLDGNRLFVGYKSGLIEIYERNKKEWTCTQSLAENKSPVKKIQILSDKKFLVQTSNSSRFFEFDNNGTPILNDTIEHETTSFSTHSQLSSTGVLAQISHKEIKLMELDKKTNKWNTIQCLPLKQTSTHFQFFPNGKQFVIVLNNLILSFWEKQESASKNQWNLIQNIPNEIQWNMIQSVQNQNLIVGCHFSPDGRLFTAHRNCTIKIWEEGPIAKWKCTAVLEYMTNYFSSFEQLEDGRLFISLIDNTITLWDFSKPIEIVLWSIAEQSRKATSDFQFKNFISRLSFIGKKIKDDISELYFSTQSAQLKLSNNLLLTMSIKNYLKSYDWSIFRIICGYKKAVQENDTLFKKFLLFKVTHLSNEQQEQIKTVFQRLENSKKRTLEDEVSNLIELECGIGTQGPSKRIKIEPSSNGKDEKKPD